MLCEGNEQTKIGVQIADQLSEEVKEFSHFSSKITIKLIMCQENKVEHPLG